MKEKEAEKAVYQSNMSSGWGKGLNSMTRLGKKAKGRMDCAVERNVR